MIEPASNALVKEILARNAHYPRKPRPRIGRGHSTLVGKADIRLDELDAILARLANAEMCLAQAERVPAVAEAIVETVGEELFSRGHTKITKQDVRAALEAALHPQSAAREEGKP